MEVKGQFTGVMSLLLPGESQIQTEVIVPTSTVPASWPLPVYLHGTSHNQTMRMFFRNCIWLLDQIKWDLLLLWIAYTDQNITTNKQKQQQNKKTQENSLKLYFDPILMVWIVSETHWKDNPGIMESFL